MPRGNIEDFLSLSLSFPLVRQQASRSISIPSPFLSRESRRSHRRFLAKKSGPPSRRHSRRSRDYSFVLLERSL